MISGNGLIKLLLLASVLLTAEATMAKTGIVMPVTLISVCDSLPSQDASPTVIKEVPKAKKKEVPISLTPTLKTIKPVQIVKPKIIKPKIKIT